MAARLRLLTILLLATVWSAAPRAGLAAPATMKGPAIMHTHPETASPASNNHGTQPLLGAIRFFQQYISPTDGPRCQFAPTCSAFGHQAIRDHGAWLGMLMTADRLMRCSYLTNPTDYPRLPTGRLADPVAANLLER